MPALPCNVLVTFVVAAPDIARWTGCRCGADNCQDAAAYKVTCIVNGGHCNPCTAESAPFHVIPNSFGEMAAGDVQVAFAGTQSEVSCPCNCWMLRC